MLAILDSAALELAEEHVPHTFVVQLIASAFQFVAESIVNAVLGDGKDAKQFATAQNAFSVLVFLCVGLWSIDVVCFWFAFGWFAYTSTTKDQNGSQFT